MRTRWLLCLLVSSAFMLATAPVAPASGRGTTHIGRRPTRPAVLGARTLKLGAHGSDVRQLQQLLRAWGYRIKADGSFGRATAAAVKRFQRAHHLRADGVVGRATLALLRRTPHRGPPSGAGDTASGSGSGGISPDGYVFPIQPLSVVASTRWWTLDQGVDIPTLGEACDPHATEVAIGSGTVVHEGIGGFGPYAPVIRMESGPWTGRYVYYGHAAPALVPVGAHVSAGQPIADVGCGHVGISVAPHLEIGVSVPGGPWCCPAWHQTADEVNAEMRQLYVDAGGK